MFGAILGDIIGSPYEFGRNDRVKDFPLFTEQSVFTDDSVMTLAIARVLLVSRNMDEENLKNEFVASMQEFGHAYPDVSYGGRFDQWLKKKNPKPYNSFGNGSAMRVSSVGWLFDSLEDVRHMARLSAEVTHNHPEGIKGAEAVACAIYLSRTGSSKTEIKTYVEKTFGYDLSRSCDEIRPDYKFDETCQGTVPEAFAAFLEGESFEDVIRTAISLGGDSDTLAAIAGSIAEAYYGIDGDWKRAAFLRLPEPLADILREFDLRVDHNMKSARHSVHDAIVFAARAHAGQKRKGTDIDYITHPLEVLAILAEMGAGYELQAAGVLHDTVEDTETTLDEIRRRFGERVATLVGSHTAPKGLDWEETRRKVLDELEKADRDTKLLVMADKLANLRSMAADYDAIGEKLWKRFNAPKEKQAWYVNAMLGILRDFEQDPAARNAYCEMTNLFKDLFVDYYVDEEGAAVYQFACFGERYCFVAWTGLWIPYDGDLPKKAVRVSRQRGERYAELWRYRLRDETLDGNERIDQAIAAYYMHEKTDEDYENVMQQLTQRIREEGNLVFPVEINPDMDDNSEKTESITFKSVRMENVGEAIAVFTNYRHASNGPKTGMISTSIDSLLDLVVEEVNFQGIIINPWDESFFLDREEVVRLAVVRREERA